MRASVCPDPVVAAVVAGGHFSPWKKWRPLQAYSPCCSPEVSAFHSVDQEGQKVTRLARCRPLSGQAGQTGPALQGEGTK